VDILVNNAGVMQLSKIEKGLRRVAHDVQCKRARPALRDRRRRTGDERARLGAPYQHQQRGRTQERPLPGAYAGTKFAVNAIGFPNSIRPVAELTPIRAEATIALLVVEPKSSPSRHAASLRPSRSRRATNALSPRPHFEPDVPGSPPSPLPLPASAPATLECISRYFK
jgi:hypothetical protein